MTYVSNDLTLCELLDDPMTQAVMRADRVERAAFVALLRNAVRPLPKPAPADRDGQAAMASATVYAAASQASLARSCCLA